MGNKQSDHKAYPEENTINFPIKDYSYEKDSLFKYFENDLNLLKYIDIFEFQQILYNYSSTKEERQESSDEVNIEYNYQMSEIMFGVFIEKKIVNHFLVYPYIANDNQIIQNSEAFYTKMFDFIYKNYKNYIKKLAREEGSKYQKNKISKLCLLSLAFNYCRAKSPYHRLLFVFNLFADENNKIFNTQDFEIFILFVLLFPSNIFVVTMWEFGKEYEAYKIKDELFYSIYDTFEVSDSKRLCDKVLEKIFVGKESLNFLEFKDNILSVDWLFSLSGIRENLRLNNDKEPNKE